MKAVQYVQKLKSERSGRPQVETLGRSDIVKEHVWMCGMFTESQDANPEFMKHLSEDPLDEEEEHDDKFVKSLFRYL